MPQRRMLNPMAQEAWKKKDLALQCFERVQTEDEIMIVVECAVI
jgi:hypothetical protein